MKYISRITFALLLILAFFSCTKDKSILEEQSVDLNAQAIRPNTEMIAKFINAFDKTLDRVQSSSELLNDEEIGDVFIDEIEEMGIETVENSTFQSSRSFPFSPALSLEASGFMREMHQISSERIYQFSSEEYKSRLEKIKTSVVNSAISIEEKQFLVDAITLVTAFVDWMDEENSFAAALADKINAAVLTDKTNAAVLTDKTKQDDKDPGGSWWKRWGRCAAGIVGTAITEGLTGCGIGVAVGAGVGSVPGCAVGAAIGVVGGGILGSAIFCN